MDWATLSSNTVQWAADRGILAHATPLGQLDKFVEESSELIDAVHAASRVRNPSAELQAELKDALGDTAVCLVILAHMHGWTLEECLAAAYNEIKDRRGSLQNGVFVKDTNKTWTAVGEDASE